MTTLSANTFENRDNEDFSHITLKCKKCGKKLIEFYATGAVIGETICDACYKLKKLKE